MGREVVAADLRLGEGWGLEALTAQPPMKQSMMGMLLLSLTFFQRTAIRPGPPTARSWYENRLPFL